MRIVKGQLLVAFVLCIIGIISVFRQVLVIPPIVRYNQRNMEYDTNQPGASAIHYMLDEKLKNKYTTTHQRLQSNFSLFLNEETGSNGDNDVQHRGILRVGTEKLGKWPKIRFHPENDTFRVGQQNAQVQGTIYAKFVDDKRVLVHVNETILPSYSSAFGDKGTQSAGLNNSYENRKEFLCKLLLNMTRKDNFDEISSWETPPVVLKVAADCSVMSENEGQGSLVLSIYGLRAASATAKVDMQFHCNSTTKSLLSLRNNRIVEEKANKRKWIFPWFIGYQSAPAWNQSWPYSGAVPSHGDICGENTFLPVDRMAAQVRSDVQKMAVTLMGSNPNEQRQHPLVPLDAEPWFSDIPMDDVIIYFPCHEDAVEGIDPTRTQIKNAGLVHFSEYIPLIHKNIKSIGVITQASNDLEDSWCRKASLKLVKYLQETYVESAVAVSLYDDDPLPLQYARIAMANHSIGSFGIFPMLAIMGSFGSGHFLDHMRPNTAVGVASFIFEQASKYDGFENLHPWQATKVLSPEKVLSMNWEDIALWLGN